MMVLKGTEAVKTSDYAEIRLEDSRLIFVIASVYKALIDLGPGVMSGMYVVGNDIETNEELLIKVDDLKFIS